MASTGKKKSVVAGPVRELPASRIVAVKTLRKNPRNARTHSKKQIGQIARSIAEFGFAVPIVADEEGLVLAGHGRLDAAVGLGLSEVPVITLTGLSPARKRAFMLADNKIAGNSAYDRALLTAELAGLGDLLVAEGLDVSVTGFEAVEVDQLVSDFETDSRDPADQTDPVWEVSDPVSVRGDVWRLGQHRLMCGDAKSYEDLDRLIGWKAGRYGVYGSALQRENRGRGGRGKIKHAEFAEASGEQSSRESSLFLWETLENAVRVSAKGAVHFVFMDWRHAYELSMAGKYVYDAHLNTVVWSKTNAGQGSFYRSQHELVFVFRAGKEPHRNNIQLDAMAAHARTCGPIRG